MEKLELMVHVNVRGVMMMDRICIPYMNETDPESFWVISFRHKKTAFQQGFSYGADDGNRTHVVSLEG